MEPISIGGAWTFTPAVHRDDRGYFLEWFRAGELSESLGYWPEIAQANCSVSRRGVIRGVHFASVPPGQAKYVTCVSGAVLDVIVDIRVGSPSYGRWEAVRLDDTSRRAVFLSEGLGHAFMALSDEATVIYLCSTPYSPGREHGVHPLDPDIGIEWPADTEPVLSGKDAAAPTLEQARRAGLLPVYADCEAYLGSLREAADARNPYLAGYPAAAAARCAATSSGKARCSAVRHSPIGGTPGPGSRPRRRDPARCRRASAPAGAARCSVSAVPGPDRRRAGRRPRGPARTRLSARCWWHGRCLARPRSGPAR